MKLTAKRSKVAVAVKLVPKKLGSMEDWLSLFTARLSEDFDVAVATYGPCHVEVERRFAECGATWHDLEKLESDLLFGTRWIREHGDIVHFSLFPPRAGMVVAAGVLSSARVIFQDCHSSLSFARRQSIASRLLDRVTFARTTAVVGVSRFVESRLSRRFGVRDPKLSVVYNGVDVGRFIQKTPPSSRRRIVCVAALVPEKGVDYLVRALAEPLLLSERLTVVGDGPERRALEHLAGDLGVADRVEFLGMRDDVQVLVGDAAVVVHPAVWGEAFGLTIAEAMAAGRPVVGCRVGAVPELIQDGETGYVVPPRDPRALALALAVLLADGALRDRMGARGRERAEQVFSMNQWVSSHVELVKQVQHGLLGR